MSRSGYSDGWDVENWSMIRWRGAVASSIRGKRGQALLREVLEALDAMPEKRLVANVLEQGGEVCALGSLGVKRGLELQGVDPEDYSQVSGLFGVAEPLIQEIEYENDEGGWGQETPEARWERMRRWVASQIKATGQ